MENTSEDDPSSASVSSSNKYAHHTESFVTWIGQELHKTNPSLAEKNPHVFRKAAYCIDAWRNRFHGNPTLWNRLFSKDRVCKEIVEAVPIVHAVLQYIERQEEARRRDPIANGNKEITIVDLCSGKGYLSMLLSEMLSMKEGDEPAASDEDKKSSNADQAQSDTPNNPFPKSMVTKFILIDKQWPLHDGQNPKSHQINWDHIYGICPRTNKSYYDTWPIPLITSKQDLKAGRTKALLTKRLFQTTDIYNDQIERTYIVLAVHLCGTLSLRAVDMFNDNPEAIQWMALKPCCLPPPVFIKQKTVFSVGQHSFDAKDVCSGGRWVQNVWKGPPRCTLPPKFEKWTHHLYKGIDLESSSDSGDERNAFCQSITTSLDANSPETNIQNDIGSNDMDDKQESFDDKSQSPLPTHDSSVLTTANTTTPSEHSPGRQGDKCLVQELVQVGGGYQNDFIFAERGIAGKTTLAESGISSTVDPSKSNDSSEETKQKAQVKKQGGTNYLLPPPILLLLMIMSCIIQPVVGYSNHAQPKQRSLPRHIAFICDGNSRWAKQRGLPVIAGHAKGANRLVDDILPALRRDGVEFCTMYGFSTENWKRSDKEIREIFTIMQQTAERMHTSLMSDSNQLVRIKILGDLDDKRIPDSLRIVLTKLEIDTNARADRSSSNGQRHTLCLAINYGGRQDILNAAKKLARASTSTNVDDISEEDFAAMLFTDGIPDPDLVIRTSGEYRLSNFLLWNAAYAELYFTDTLWPDFDEKEMAKSLDWFVERRRRFGAREGSPVETAP